MDTNSHNNRIKKKAYFMLKNNLCDNLIRLFFLWMPIAIALVLWAGIAYNIRIGFLASVLICAVIWVGEDYINRFCISLQEKMGIAKKVDERLKVDNKKMAKDTWMSWCVGFAAYMLFGVAIGVILSVIIDEFKRAPIPNSLDWPEMQVFLGSIGLGFVLFLCAYLLRGDKSAKWFFLSLSLTDRNALVVCFAVFIGVILWTAIFR